MKKITIVTLLLIVFSGVVLADQVTLKNGDRLTGKIVKTAGDKLVIKTDLAGELSIDLGVITNITTDQPLYVTLADGQTVSGVMTVSDARVDVRRTNGNPVSINRADIRAIRSEDEHLAYQRSLNPRWLEGWSGGADIGIALTSGNSDVTNVATGLTLTRATPGDKTYIYAASVYSRDSTSGESRTVANTVRGGFRYDRDFNRKWFAYVFTDLEHNGLQDLTLRLVPGGGIGYHAIRNERTQLDLLGGLAWNKEYFKGDFNDRSSAEAQAGQTLVHRFNSRVSLTEQLFLFPNLTNGGEYRVNFDSSLVMDISRRIGWQLTLSDRYLSNPPPGFEKNDLILTTGLKIKLGDLK